MHFVRLDGVLIHYRLAGPPDAPVVAFVNSLGTDARIWDRVIAPLAEHYRIVSYDKRGHGLSDIPDGPYALDRHLDDLEGLLNHLGIERLALAGVSVGGLIAQGYALRNPARLTGLVLCNTAAKIGDSALWAARIETAQHQGMAGLADGVMERWFSAGFRHDKPAEVAGWRNMLLRSSPIGYAATCATLRDADLTGDVGRIDTPTLVVAGEADQATPVALVKTLADAIPAARFSVLACGHIPSIEQPDALAALMHDFLEEVGHV